MSSAHSDADIAATVDAAATALADCKEQLRIQYAARPFPQTRMRRLRPAVSPVTWCGKRLTPADLIFPVSRSGGREPARGHPSMPGIERLSIDLLIEQAASCNGLGVPAMALFPVVGAAQEPAGRGSLQPRRAGAAHGARAHDALPELGLIDNVAWTPFTTHGQDGIIDDSGYTNDVTTEYWSNRLCPMPRPAPTWAPST